MPDLDIALAQLCIAESWCKQLSDMIASYRLSASRAILGREFKIETAQFIATCLEEFSQPTWADMGAALKESQRAFENATRLREPRKLEIVKPD